MFLVAALLLLAGVIVYGPHVIEGGFTIDDWSHAATAAHPPQNLLSHYWSFTSNRPVLVGYVPLTHLVFGTEAWLHHAWSIMLAVAMSTALYAVLRRLSIRPAHAGAIALLVLLFPWSDATRFWATASHVSLSIALGLTGIVLALRGLDARADGRPRAGLALHAAAVALYAISVLTYEIAGVVLLLAGTLYFTRAGWPVVRLRWAMDIAAILPCLAWTALRADRERPSLAQMLDQAEAIADGGATVLAFAALPFGAVGRQTILTGLVTVVTAAILVWALLPRDDDSRPILGRWLAMVGGGLAIVIAGWVLYVPADPYYNPAQPGVGNRVNAMAAIGLTIVVYAVIVLSVTLLFRGLPHRARAAAALSAVLAAMLAIGYADKTRDDQQAWARATTAANDVLAAITSAIPDPPVGSTIYTFGHPGSERPGILVFGFTWDLQGAVRLEYNDPGVTAYPILEGTTIDCQDELIAPVGPGWVPEWHGGRYGLTYFVDAQSAVAERIDSKEACLSTSSSFIPGPVTRTP